jgi:hypothetical protein
MSLMHAPQFHASHTYYRFHETSTHRAFPVSADDRYRTASADVRSWQLDLMIVIVCLLDCHSLLQATL